MVELLDGSTAVAELVDLVANVGKLTERNRFFAAFLFAGVQATGSPSLDSPKLSDLDIMT
jgi:hypothetical protein